MEIKDMFVKFVHFS